MNAKSPFNCLLVPTDFSDASTKAFEWAQRALDGDASVVIVLHVVDETLVDLIAAHDFGPRDKVASRLREHARARLADYEAASADIEVDTIVCEGVPFLEIVRKADEFAVDAIVMGRVGMQDHFEKLLFGSTAEKVLRASRRPVIVLPAGGGDG